MSQKQVNEWQSLQKSWIDMANVLTQLIISMGPTNIASAADFPELQPVLEKVRDAMDIVLNGQGWPVTITDGTTLIVKQEHSLASEVYENLVAIEKMVAVETHIDLKLIWARITRGGERIGSAIKLLS